MDNLQLKSLVTAEGYVELFLESSPVPDCAEDEVLIEVHAERDPRCSLVVVNARFHKEIYSDCG